MPTSDEEAAELVLELAMLSERIAHAAACARPAYRPMLGRIAKSMFDVLRDEGLEL